MSDNLAYAPPVPPAVRRAAERAEQLAREFSLDPGADPAAAEAELTPVISDAPAPEPVVESVPEAAPPPAPTEPDWQQRYNTLKGKYDSELPQMRGQIATLENLIANMQRLPESAPQPASTMPMLRPSPEIPEADVEAYGKDLIEASQRWAEAKWQPLVVSLEDRLRQLETGQGQLSQRTAAQSVEHALDGAVPGWRDINVDPKFVAWLRQVDPFSGVTRQRMITEAHGAGDSTRTIAFFRAYLHEHTAVTPPSGTQTGQTAPVELAARIPLETLAVPGRGQTTTPPNPGAPEKRTWTRDQIAAFYREKREGRWASREADAARIEQDIITAPMEGRLRQ